MTEATKKTLTGSQVLSEKITLGGCEEKQSGRHRYLKTQVIYDEQPFFLKERGNLKNYSWRMRRKTIRTTPVFKNPSHL